MEISIVFFCVAQALEIENRVFFGALRGLCAHRPFYL